MTKIKRRAMSSEQKEQRRQDILDSARDLFDSTTDYNALLMKHIAENIGLTKGTLYLYFKTKEEVFLALYSQEFERCFVEMNRVLDSLAEPVSSDQVADAIAKVITRQLTFLRLNSMLHSVLEQNIDFDTALSFKTLLRDRVLETGLKLEEVLPVLKGQGAKTLLAVHALLIGYYHVSLPTPALDEILERPDMQFMKTDFANEFQEALRLMLFAVTEKAKAQAS